MYRALRIRFVGSSESFRLHEFKNFGELIYCEFRDEFEVSIEEIDKTGEGFYVRKIHKRDAKTAAKRAQTIADKEKATPFIEITEIDDEK